MLLVAVVARVVGDDRVSVFVEAAEGDWVVLVGGACAHGFVFCLFAVVVYAVEWRDVYRLAVYRLASFVLVRWIGCQVCDLALVRVLVDHVVVVGPFGLRVCRFKAARRVRVVGVQF